MFLKSSVNSSFEFFKRTVFPTEAELKKCISENIDKNIIWKFFIASILNNTWFLFAVENFQRSYHIFWRSDNPVSIVCEFWKDSGIFVIIMSMHFGFSGFRGGSGEGERMDRGTSNIT